MPGQHGFQPTTSEDHRAWIWVESQPKTSFTENAKRLPGRIDPEPCLQRALYGRETRREVGADLVG